MSLSEVWSHNAAAWARFARRDGHDKGFPLNFPGFLELLPPPPARTLDLGCGEGRVGGELAARGYDVVGIDYSQELVELARERHEAVRADASSLPFDAESFELVIAFMSLFNMSDLEGAVSEAARVLVPGGRFCAAVVHPTFNAGVWTDDGRFELVRSYFDDSVRVWQSSRDGIEMTFHDRQVPLERYAAALQRAGLLIERVREIPSEKGPAPLFLQLRALKP